MGPNSFTFFVCRIRRLVSCVDDSEAAHQDKNYEDASRGKHQLSTPLT
jgi:hypothetical protein